MNSPLFSAHNIGYKGSIFPFHLQILTMSVLSTSEDNVSTTTGTVSDDDTDDVAVMAYEVIDMPEEAIPEVSFSLYFFAG